MSDDLPVEDKGLPDDVLWALGPERSNYLLFHEAVCWIAFDHYDFPPIGPRSPLEFMSDDTAFAEEASRYQGMYALAEAQLKAAVENGLVSLAGRYECAHESGQTAENENSGSLRMRLHKIPHEAIAAGDFYEGDGQYFVAGRWYETLIVPVNELGAAFSGFIRGAKSSESYPVVPAQNKDPVSRKRRGRPPEWDWDALRIEIVALANSPDGLPDKQADLESWAADYFQRKYEREPSVASIRSKLSPIYERLRQKSQ